MHSCSRSVAIAITVSCLDLRSGIFWKIGIFLRAESTLYSGAWGTGLNSGTCGSGNKEPLTKSNTGDRSRARGGVSCFRSINCLFAERSIDQDPQAKSQSITDLIMGPSN